MGIDITVTLSLKTCGCGSTYAVPHWLTESAYECPMCAARKYFALESRKNEYWHENEHLKRVIAGMKGVRKK